MGCRGVWTESGHHVVSTPVQHLARLPAPASCYCGLWGAGDRGLTHGALHTRGPAHTGPCTHGTLHTRGPAHMWPCTHGALQVAGE